MNMKVPSTLLEHWEIINLGDLPGTSADGIPLAGSSRAPWMLGKPSAYAPQRPLQGRRPPYCWWQLHGFSHPRARGAGPGITLPHPAPDLFVTASPTGSRADRTTYGYGDSPMR